MTQVTDLPQRIAVSSYQMLNVGTVKQNREHLLLANIQSISKASFEGFETRLWNFLSLGKEMR